MVQYPRLLRVSGRSTFNTPGSDEKISRITFTLKPPWSARCFVPEMS